VVERAVVVLSSLSNTALAAAFASARSTVPSWSGSRLASAEAANEGDALTTAMAGRETASKDARVKVFTVVSFIMMLLERSGMRYCSAQPLALSQRGLAVIGNRHNRDGHKGVGNLSR
jgi:hypothetical protein